MPRAWLTKPRGRKDEAGRYSHVACVGLMRKAKLSVDTKNQSEDDTWRELADALTSVDGFTRAVDAGRSLHRHPRVLAVVQG